MKTLAFFLSAILVCAFLPACSGGSPTKTSFFGPVPDPLHKVLPHVSPREPVKENLFVLIDDPDGKTGSMTVGNEKGARTISQANVASQVKDANTPPPPPAPMDEKDIKRIFGAALAAQPPPVVACTLYFKTGTTTFTPESEKALATVLATIGGRHSKEIMVAGHTDRVGAEKMNTALSRRRAERIKEILVSKGVPPEAIETEWHGEEKPAVKTKDGVPEGRNRRVEITVR